jgi:hypothetical protein
MMHSLVLCIVVSSLPTSAHARTLVYNRVDKAASASMTSILLRQADTLRLQRNVIRNGADFPNKKVYNETLSSLNGTGIFIRHAYHLRDSDPGTVWINMLREPVARWKSQYYWQRSSKFRRATGHGAWPTVDPCNVSDPEFTFEDCIRRLNATNAPFLFPTFPPRQSCYFCEPADDCPTRIGCNASSDCTLHTALHALRHRYHLVGITELFAESIVAFEALLPEFFRGASRYANKTRANSRVSTYEQRRPSTDVYQIVSARATGYADEVRFYEEALRLFDQKRLRSSVTKQNSQLSATSL